MDGTWGPQEGHPHRCTLVYLHAFGRCGKEYMPPLLDHLSPGFPCPWVPEGDLAPGLRVVLPTAQKLQLPWGPLETSWHAYVAADSNRVGDPDSLAETRARLAKILEEEVDRLNGDASLVFIGGLSQGCTTALDTYLREAPRLGLGGFVGSVGFLPSDEDGFEGSDAALDQLIACEAQALRPVWLQCALDDQWVPWALAKKSLQRAQGRLPGLALREVEGRGHIIDDWEGHWLNDFMREHVASAYT